MENIRPNHKSEDIIDEFDLGMILKIIWRKKIQIILITSIFSIYSVFYALSIPNQYKATAVLAPAQKNDSIGSSAGTFGGLASLAGINIGGSGDNETRQALEIMKSWSFIEKFIATNNFAALISAVNGWNRSENKLLYDEDKYDSELEKWLPDIVEPKSWLLYKSFSGMLEINEDKLTGLITVSIEYYSPILAKQILDKYINAINIHMQKRELNKVSRSIDYLQVQINNTPIAEMRDVFYTIIEDQIKNKMLAEASLDYAFVPVSLSMIPEVKSKPRRAAICVLWTLFGGIISVLIILFRYYWASYYKK